MNWLGEILVQQIVDQVNTFMSAAGSNDPGPVMSNLAPVFEELLATCGAGLRPALAWVSNVVAAVAVSRLPDPVTGAAVEGNTGDRWGASPADAIAAAPEVSIVSTVPGPVPLSATCPGTRAAVSHLLASLDAPRKAAVATLASTVARKLQDLLADVTRAPWVQGLRSFSSRYGAWLPQGPGSDILTSHVALADWVQSLEREMATPGAPWWPVAATPPAFKPEVVMPVPWDTVSRVVVKVLRSQLDVSPQNSSIQAAQVPCPRWPVSLGPHGPPPAALRSAKRFWPAGSQGWPSRHATPRTVSRRSCRHSHHGPRGLGPVGQHHQRL